MTTIDILETALRLRNAGEPFVLATVLRAEKPTSAKPGAKAIITPDGKWIGWIGGSCSRPTVEYEARRVLASGEPLVVHLASTETCASGGTLDIYLEPYLPQPELIVLGHLPVAEALVRLAKPLGFRISVMSPEGHPDQFPDADRFSDTIDLEGANPEDSFCVIASHGNYDADALAAVKNAKLGYTALVASRKRAASLDVPDSVKVPAGLDIGAVTPEEIALSILAEIVSVRRARGERESVAETPEPEVFKDPICGMMVNAEGARFTVSRDDETVYFCGPGCKEAYELKHAD